jgi:hypothetical protein
MGRHHRFRWVAVILIGAAALLAGCGGGADKPDVTVSPTPSVSGVASPSVSTTPPAKNLPVLSMTGAGHYQLGAKLSTLDSELQQKESSTACGDWTVAKGQGDYADLAVVFFEGAVVYVSIDQPTLATDKGIKVGSTKDEATAAYPAGTILSDGQGGSALSVHGAGGNGLLLRFNQSSATVATIDAGKANDLDFRFTEGEGC